MHSSDVGLIVLVVVDDAAVVASSAEWKLHCQIDSQYHTVSFSFFLFSKIFYINSPDSLSQWCWFLDKQV